MMYVDVFALGWIILRGRPLGWGIGKCPFKRGFLRSQWRFHCIQCKTNTVCGRILHAAYLCVIYQYISL